MPTRPRKRRLPRVELKIENGKWKMK